MIKFNRAMIIVMAVIIAVSCAACGVSTEERVNGYLDKIVNNEAVAMLSNPYSYIEARQKEFDGLVEMGGAARDIMIAMLGASDENGLREYIMAAACNAIRPIIAEDGFDSGRAWYEAYLRVKYSETEPATLGDRGSIYSCKTPYAGDSTAMVTLAQSMPFTRRLSFDGLELKTDAEPYGANIRFVAYRNIENAAAAENFKNSAYMMFALVYNLDNVSFTLTDKQSGTENTFEFTRAQAEADFACDVREFAESEEAFGRFYFRAAWRSESAGVDKTDIDAVIASAVLSRSRGGYAEGETQTEGHKILRVDEENNAVTVYCIVSYGEFAFQNDIFTLISGSGGIPTVITLIKHDNGEYEWDGGYTEPMDGAEYLPSLKLLFPVELHSEALAADKYYNELKEQREAYAAAYLAVIGREAEVSDDYVPKTLLTDLGISVELSNELLGQMYGDYPYWIGTLERIEDGVRYIYRQAYERGDEMIIFTKELEDGTVVYEQAVTAVTESD